MQICNAASFQAIGVPKVFDQLLQHSTTPLYLYVSPLTCTDKQHIDEQTHAMGHIVMDKIHKRPFQFQGKHDVILSIKKSLP